MYYFAPSPSLSLYLSFFSYMYERVQSVWENVAAQKKSAKKRNEKKKNILYKNVEETITLIFPVDIDSYGIDDKCDTVNVTQHFCKHCTTIQLLYDDVVDDCAQLQASKDVLEG